MRLQSALDNDLLVAVERFLNNGVQPDVTNLYTALQRSNSSLKRRPKKVLEASLERVLTYLDLGDPDIDDHDSDAAAEAIQDVELPDANIMNRGLRANLAPAPAPAVESPHRKLNGEAIPKRQRISKPSIDPPDGVSLLDIGGMGNVIAQLNRLVVMPMKYSQLFTRLCIPPTKGVLLFGPPGCGKTMMCRALANAAGRPFVEILGPSIVSGMSGESEKGIRDRFEEAKRNAPCIIFIDEIDAIAPKRETSQSQMEKRIVGQLLVSMDDLQHETDKPVIVLAATNRPDSIDPALRRGGRFGTEINIGVPNESMRKNILTVLTRKMPLAPDVDLSRLANLTAGFVGSDLHDLITKAATNQLESYTVALETQAAEMGISFPDAIPEAQTTFRLVARADRPDLPLPLGFDAIHISMADFLAVLPGITPSSRREGFATIPDVSWKDIGALHDVRQKLERAIVRPIQNPAVYEHFGITSPSGVLLWGPPGCGKTLIAKAAAAESKANFISIKGPELLNKFVGESEAAVRKVFLRAKSSVPCVIFFDEFDALVPRRDAAGSEASARVVNTLLTELDGLDVRAGIYIIAATNRPDMIDDAMLRPGRLDKLLFVGLPGPEERVDIMRALTRNRPCEFTQELEALIRGETCGNFSGADLSALLQGAVSHAIDEGKMTLAIEDFVAAGRTVRSSVRDVEKYLRLNKSFGQR